MEKTGSGGALRSGDAEEGLQGKLESLRDRGERVETRTRDAAFDLRQLAEVDPGLRREILKSQTSRLASASNFGSNQLCDGSSRHDRWILHPTTDGRQIQTPIDTSWSKIDRLIGCLESVLAAIPLTVSA